MALNAWARRAEVTCDRSGLICTRDLEASVGCLVKLAIGSRKLYSDINLDEYLAQMEEASRGVGRFDELMRTHPYLPKRVAALRLFAQTHYYRSMIGAPTAPTNGVNGTGAPASPTLTQEECDARVADIISIIKR
jgi:hypothetical protein